MTGISNEFKSFLLHKSCETTGQHYQNQHFQNSANQSKYWQNLGNFVFLKHLNIGYFNFPFISKLSITQRFLWKPKLWNHSENQQPGRLWRGKDRVVALWKPHFQRTVIVWPLSDHSLEEPSLKACLYHAGLGTFLMQQPWGSCWKQLVEII